MRNRRFQGPKVGDAKNQNSKAVIEAKLKLMKWYYAYLSAATRVGALLYRNGVGIGDLASSESEVLNKVVDERGNHPDSDPHPQGPLLQRHVDPDPLSPDKSYEQGRLGPSTVRENRGSRVRHIWVVRHGMRIDFANPGWIETAEEPYNPPLAPVGLLQAEETVRRFQGVDLEAIYVSPFLRTLQTARLIAESKGLPLFVEPGFFEFLKKDEFTDNPIKPGPAYAKLLGDFPEISSSYSSDISPSYPESIHDLDRRIDLALSRIFESSYREILIVSHGTPIKSIYRHFTGSVPEDYQPMSSVTRFDLRDGHWRLAIDGDSSHLSTADTTGKAFYAELERIRRSIST